MHRLPIAVIHRFVFSVDHNSFVMHMIAEETGGMFSFSEDETVL